MAEVAGFEEFVLAKDDPGTKPTPDDRLKRTNMTQNINNWTDFQMPSRLNVETETLTERYGKFFAQPFERGFGTTIGNSIRRALLSSIEGAAITAVEGEVLAHDLHGQRPARLQVAGERDRVPEAAHITSGQRAGARVGDVVPLVARRSVSGAFCDGRHLRLLASPSGRGRRSALAQDG